jgi:hypothetical protein
VGCLYDRMRRAFGVRRHENLPGTTSRLLYCVARLRLHSACSPLPQCLTGGVDVLLWRSVRLLGGGASALVAFLGRGSSDHRGERDPTPVRGGKIYCVCMAVFRHSPSHLSVRRAS